jgi:lipopolysaccharide transport system ATP-binding protein
MNAVELNRVYKRFRVDFTGSGRRLLSLDRRRVEKWALRDVSLAVKEGEAIGVVGSNGSGKSTLLRIIAGLTRPTRGSVRVASEVTGILTLGGVLEPLLSGTENALTGTILAGMSKRKAVARLPAIAEFAELGDQMDQPLRTFSDGMKLRLAFAIAVNVDARILLLDEVLAVGDLRFREKCLNHLKSISETGVTVLLTSHEPSHIARLCSRTIWLADGHVRVVGETEGVLARYANAMLEAVPPPELLADGGARVGSGEVEISDVRLIGPRGTSVGTLRSGDPVTVEIDFTVHVEVPDAVIGVHAHDSVTGNHFLNLSTEGDGHHVGPLPPKGTIRLHLDRLDLAGGRYFLDVGVYEAHWERPYAMLWKALAFEVRGQPATGLLAPPRQWTIG